jgi:hypothetical protein
MERASVRRASATTMVSSVGGANIAAGVVCGGGRPTASPMLMLSSPRRRPICPAPTDARATAPP